MKTEEAPLLFNTAPLVVLPELAVALGLNEAIVLQQLHYLVRLSKGRKGHFRKNRWWTWQTYEDWQRQFPWWSIGTIRRIFANLTKKLNVVITEQFSKPPDTTLWYTIDYEAYNALLKKGDQLDQSKSDGVINLIGRGDQLDQSGRSNRSDHLYTEITPETTPEITSSPLPPNGRNPEEKKNFTPEKLPLPADPPNPNPPFQFSPQERGNLHATQITQDANESTQKGSPSLAGNAGAALLNQPEPLDQPIEPHEDSDSEAANENDSSFQRIINERNNLSAIFSLDGHYAHDVGLAGSSSPPRLDADIQDGGIGSGRNAVGNDGIEQPRSSASAQALSQVDKNDENLSQSNKSGKPSNRVDSFGNNRDLHARTEPGRDRGDADTAGHSNGATVGGANSATRVVVDSSKHTHPTQKSDDRLKNQLHPWQKSRKRNDFDEGFVTYLRDKHLPTTDFYKSKGVTEGDAKNWINQRQWDEAGLAQVYAKWDDYQEDLSKQQQTQAASKVVESSQQSQVPDFPILPHRWHQKHVDEYFALGKELFIQKYQWLENWLLYLERYKHDLFKKLEQASS